MNEKFRRFYEASKALITYVDREDVFDKSADMGCGGLDTYRSDAFQELIVTAGKALADLEREMKRTGAGSGKQEAGREGPASLSSLPIRS
ncbi:MAG: hypothetical protein ACP5SH_22610 [Syntrophobacteraceae bacterium]